MVRFFHVKTLNKPGPGTERGEKLSVLLLKLFCNHEVSPIIKSALHFMFQIVTLIYVPRAFVVLTSDKSVESISSSPSDPVSVSSTHLEIALL